MVSRLWTSKKTTVLTGRDELQELSRGGMNVDDALQRVGTEASAERAFRLLSSALAMGAASTWAAEEGGRMVRGK